MTQAPLLPDSGTIKPGSIPASREQFVSRGGKGADVGRIEPWDAAKLFFSSVLNPKFGFGATVDFRVAVLLGRRAEYLLGRYASEDMTAKLGMKWAESAQDHYSLASRHLIRRHGLGELAASIDALVASRKDKPDFPQRALPAQERWDYIANVQRILTAPIGNELLVPIMNQINNATRGMRPGQKGMVFEVFMAVAAYGLRLAAIRHGQFDEAGSGLRDLRRSSL